METIEQEYYNTTTDIQIVEIENLSSLQNIGSSNELNPGFESHFDPELREELHKFDECKFIQVCKNFLFKF